MKTRNIYKRSIKLLKNQYIILAALLLAGFVVRLYRIDNPIADWHSWRQADTASVSRIYLRQGIDLLHPRYYDISTAQSGMFNPQGWRMVEFPIFNLIHALLASTFGSVDFRVWGRLVSVFSGIGSGYLLYLIGKRLYGKWVGFLAAFYYLLLPYNIYFTRVILPEPLAVFFAIGSVWAGLVYIQTRRGKYLALSAAMLALALLVKPYSIFLFIPIPILMIKKFSLRGSIRNKRLVLAGLIALLPFLIWRIWVRQYPEGIPFWKWIFNEDGIRFKPSFWRWIFAERIGRMILGVWGVVIMVFGILDKKLDSFVNLFLLAAVMFLVTIATANVKHDYYQIFIIPPISLALASGTFSLWFHKAHDRILTRGLCIFSVFMMFTYTAYLVKDFYNINRYEIINAGSAVQSVSDEDDLVIAPYNGDTAFLYQTGRFGWPVVDRSIPELIELGADYYVSVNYDSLTNQLMEEYPVVKKTEQFVIIELAH